MLIHTSKALDKEDYERIGERACAVLSKGNGSRKKAGERLGEALRQAGLHVPDQGPEPAQAPPSPGEAAAKKKA